MKDMSFSPSRCKELIADLARDAGFHSVGIAAAGPVEPEYAAIGDRWTDCGFNGCLAYMERYRDIRHDPRLLLEGCRSIIVMAASYYTGDTPNPEAAQIAMYARGDDYHEVLRERAGCIVRMLNDNGFTARICVDTAPLAERYWAVKAGIGFIGRNGTIIIPGAGSYFFITSILTDAPLPPDEPCEADCAQCGECVCSCPANAINPDRTIDARRCLSCLTIELRGDLPAGTDPGNRVFGCDTCQNVCPHNSLPAITPIAEFRMRPQLKNLTAENILSMNQEEFSAMFRKSAIKRAKLAGLQRNAAAILGRSLPLADSETE